MVNNEKELKLVRTLYFLHWEDNFSSNQISEIQEALNIYQKFFENWYQTRLNEFLTEPEKNSKTFSEFKSHFNSKTIDKFLKTASKVYKIKIDDSNLHLVLNDVWVNSKLTPNDSYFLKILDQKIKNFDNFDFESSNSMELTDFFNETFVFLIEYFFLQQHLKKNIFELKEFPSFFSVSLNIMLQMDFEFYLFVERFIEDLYCYKLSKDEFL